MRDRQQKTSPRVAHAVRRAQEGDRSAFGFLFARYADDVCACVRGIVGDQHEAEDLTQLVFVKLIAVIGKYDEREAPFFVWMLEVGRNVAFDHIQRDRTIPAEDAHDQNGLSAGLPSATTVSRAMRSEYA
jgi:RNA polymerase sigma factor (sigma-70 family)